MAYRIAATYQGIGSGGGELAMPDRASIFDPIAPPTVGNSGSVAAPGAGVTFVSIGVPTATGLYKVTYGYVLTGTAEITLDNVEFLPWGGNPTIRLPSVSTAGTGWHYGTIEQIYGGGGGFLLRARVAATAGSIYTGYLLATRIA